MKIDDLILTDETEMRSIWIFHKGYSGADRGVYAKIAFKVYRTKEGADLTGIPQVAALVKKNFLATCETITRINGNKQPYTMPIPELVVLTLERQEGGKVVKISGLDFVATYWGNELRCQPTTVKQINDLLLENDFKGSYYGNDNRLRLELTTNKNEFYKQLK